MIMMFEGYPKTSYIEAHYRPRPYQNTEDVIDNNDNDDKWYLIIDDIWQVFQEVVYGAWLPVSTMSKYRICY